MTASENDLLDTIETIRQRDFPEISADLVRRIIAIEANFTENRLEAYKQLSSVIDEHLQTKTEV